MGVATLNKAAFRTRQSCGFFVSNIKDVCKTYHPYIRLGVGCSPNKALPNKVRLVFVQLAKHPAPILLGNRHIKTP